MRRVPVGIAMAACLAACGSSRDRNLYDGSDRSFQESREPGKNPVKDEVRSLPFKHVEWEYKLTRHQVRRMTLSGNHLYVESPTNEVIAVDRFSGEVKWIYRVDSDTPLEFAPVVASGVPERIRALELKLAEINREIDSVIRTKGPGEETQKLQNDRAKKREELRDAQFGDNTYFLSRQVLYCLDRESGFLRWSRRLDFIPSAQPFATQTHIFIPAADHSRVYALSVKDKGAPMEFFRAEMEKEENQITTRPIYEDPNLYFASHDGNVYSYREWKQGTTFRTGGAIKADLTIHRYYRKVTKPDPADSTKKRDELQELKFLLVGGMDNALYAIDATNGQLLWKYECGGPIKSPAVAKDLTVYVKTEEGALFALNLIPLHRASDPGSWRRDGERRWKVPLGERFLLKGRSYVYVLGPNAEIYAMDESTGDIAGRYKTRLLQHLIGNTVDDFFYCATAEGHLFALKESKENY